MSNPNNLYEILKAVYDNNGSLTAYEPSNPFEVLKTVYEEDNTGNARLRINIEGLNLNPDEVHQGDINIYVETPTNGGNDDNDGSQSSPVATLKRAWNLVPKYVNGIVYIHVGEGEFDWNSKDFAETKLNSGSYLLGTIEDLNEDVTLSQHPDSKWRYSLSSTPTNDLDGKVLYLNDARNKKTYPVIDYYSTTNTVDVANPSYPGTYKVGNLLTTLNITRDDMRYVFGLQNLNGFKINLTTNSVIISPDPHIYYFPYFIGCIFHQTETLTILKVGTNRTLINNFDNKATKIVSDNSLRNQGMKYGAAIVARDGINTNSYNFYSTQLQNTYIKNYKYAVSLTLYQMANYSELLDTRWNYSAHFENCENIYVIDSEDIKINSEDNNIYINCDNLLHFTNKKYVRGLNIKIYNSNDLPTNLINSGNTIEEYELTDEQIVNKVIINSPNHNLTSSPIMELSTTERDTYFTNNPNSLYDGRVIYNTDSNSREMWNGSAWTNIELLWEEDGSSSKIHPVSATTVEMDNLSIIDDGIELTKDNALIHFTNNAQIQFDVMTTIEGGYTTWHTSDDLEIYSTTGIILGVDNGKAFEIGDTHYSNADIKITDSNKGFVLTSPNGSFFRITVDDNGNLVTTQLSS